MTDSEIRDLSKALYGHRYRLEVAARIAAWGNRDLSVRGLAAEMARDDLPRARIEPRVRDNFSAFAAAGLLERGAPEGYPSQVFYAVRPSAYWEAALQMWREVGGRPLNAREDISTDGKGAA